MKKIGIYFFTMIASFAMTACEDWGFLQEHPKKALEENFMVNAKTVEAEINAIYNQLSRDQAFGRSLSVLSESLSDYCYGRGTYLSTYSTGLTTGGISLTKDIWAVLYRAIRYANGILSKIDEVDLSEEEYQSLTGEIRFLRALSYSYLARYYGAVPFFDENNKNEFSKPRTPEKDIWAFVLEEAKYAASNLPTKVSEIGRPTTYAALMLETEAALYLQDYQTAVDCCKQIVSSNAYSLVKVNKADDFENLYGYKVVNSSEEIFYIKFNRQHTNMFEWMFLVAPNPVCNVGALAIYTDSINNKVIQEWKREDLRRQYSLYHSTSGALNTQTPSGLICLKYRDYETNGTTMASDWPLYRYADALLYYAEAICQLNGKPDKTAMEMINKVHRRAYGKDPEVEWEGDFELKDYSTEDKFIELLLKEKVYEQCFEGKRYCDLKRQGKLAEYAVKAGRVKSESEVKDAAYWWPIPDDEFNYNDSLDPAKDQNPGY